MPSGINTVITDIERPNGMVGFASEPDAVTVNDLSGRGSGDDLAINEIGQVTMKTTKPLIFDKYEENRATGSFILIDTSTNEKVGAGMIGIPTCFPKLSL